MHDPSSGTTRDDDSFSVGSCVPWIIIHDPGVAAEHLSPAAIRHETVCSTQTAIEEMILIQDKNRAP